MASKDYNSDKLTHRSLCKLGGKYLQNVGIVPFIRCKYTFIELERVGECPDVIGFGGGACSQLIEVKVSRADFLSDKKKYWRKHPEYGLGSHRSYLCPKDMISVDELPPFWGLLYADENGNIEVIRKPEKQEYNYGEEQYLLINIMRREGIKNGVYSYKKYKGDESMDKMTNAEYKLKYDEIIDSMNAEFEKLCLDYAKSNAIFAIGDTIKSVNGDKVTMVIENIGTVAYYHAYLTPKIRYRGFAVDENTLEKLDGCFEIFIMEDDAVLVKKRDNNLTQ